MRKDRKTLSVVRRKQTNKQPATGELGILLMVGKALYQKEREKETQ